VAALTQSEENVVTQLHPSTVTGASLKHGDHVEARTHKDKGMDCQEHWQQKWRCMHCPDVGLHNPNAAGGINNHLEEVHEIFLRPEETPVQQMDTEQCRSSYLTLKTSFVRWVTEDRIRFQEVESQALQRLLKVLNPQAAEFAPQTRWKIG
jgi:hypothetical protein